MEKKGISLAAICLTAALLLSSCHSGSGNSQVTQNNDGNYVVECSADCAVVEQNLDYTVTLTVTTDADGTILNVEDNGTSIPDGKDGAYQNAEALFGQLEGKNKDNLSDADAISGATYSSNAILKAVENGLDAIAESQE